jgi:hypothetical protein
MCKQCERLTEKLWRERAKNRTLAWQLKTLRNRVEWTNDKARTRARQVRVLLAELKKAGVLNFTKIKDSLPRFHRDAQQAELANRMNLVH